MHEKLILFQKNYLKTGALRTRQHKFYAFPIQTCIVAKIYQKLFILVCIVFASKVKMMVF